MSFTHSSCRYYDRKLADHGAGLKAISIILKVVIYSILICTGTMNAQSNSMVLPHNGNSTHNAPEGYLRYQRGFYLITPKEMLSSGLVANDTVNCIGFTIGAAQDSTTKGNFKVYLQNTLDTVSRSDTNWIVVPGLLSNSYVASGIFPGNYEWQVKTNCSGYSSLQNFRNDNLSPCEAPTHLAATNVAATTATLNWVAPASVVTKYYIEYKISSDISWIRDSSMTNSIAVINLLPNSGYQWRVKSTCAMDSSEYIHSWFNTEHEDLCGEPSALNVVSVADTSAILNWTGLSDIDYYTVRFRRAGTTNWQGSIAFTDSISINFGLVAGTLYEWQVKAHCAFDSVGSYVTGPNFTTTGPGACYAPEGFYVDSISSTAFKLSWDVVPGVTTTSYELRYRAKDYIHWNNAILPMDFVHNDSICIPDTIGPYFVPFELGLDTFVYTGGGVYVAWEYERPLGSLSTISAYLGTDTNTGIKGINGQDSIKHNVSFITPGDGAAMGLDTILNASRIRPETWLCSPSLKDSVAIVEVYALGKYAPTYTYYPISALIRNYSLSTQTYTVTLTVKSKVTNAVRYTVTQNITIDPDTTGLIVFAGWNPSLLETDSIIISIPAQPNENVLNNNRNFYLQTVTSSIVSFEDGAESIAQAGTDTSAGLTLARHLMIGCGKINGAQIYLSRSSIGHAVYAVALDTNNVILAQSSSFTPDSSQVDQFHSFYFPSTTRLLLNEEYYIGLAQPADTIGYFPVGVQWEGVQIRDSAYYRGTINGDSLWHHPYPGRLMIRAELIPGGITPTITGDLFLCAGSTDTLVVSGIVARYADSVIAYSSQYGANQFSANEVLGIPNVYPSYGNNIDAWTSTGVRGREFLVLHFPNPDAINFVDIYETLNPGSVDSIFAKDEGTGMFNLVWSGSALAGPPVAKRNRIQFPITSYNVSAIRITFNMDTVPGFSAIDAVCIGEITTPGLFASYGWTGGSTNDTLLITLPGGYKVTTVDANGCMSMDSVTSISPVTITPIITVVGPSIFCPGDSVKLISSQIGGNTWSNGATTDSIYIKTGGAYTVTYDDGTGCGITTSLPVNFTLFASPIVNIIGPSIICPGKPITLNASATFNSYLWTTGSTADTTDIFYPGLYILKVTDANGCMASDTIITTLGSNPNPLITGSTLFCSGDSTLLSAGAGFTSYLWTTGETTSSIYVKTQGSFSVVVTNADGCEGGTGIATTLLDAPIATVSGGDGFCPIDSVLLIGSGGLSYLWSNGSTNPMTYVNTPGTYLLTVIDFNGCQDTISKSVVQFVPPDPFIAGTLSFCAGGSVTTLDADQGYQSYLWSTGETSPSITVSTVDTFSVTVTDVNGCVGSTMAITSLDGGIPAVPGPITGNLFGMCNTVTPATYSIANVPNSTCYVWKVPKGATIVSGYMADSSVFFNTIQVVFDNSFMGGFIEVAAHNDCGSSPSFNGRSIYVSPAPGSVPGSISGQATGVCKLQSVTYSVPPISGASGYLWTTPLGADIISGQGTNSINVNFASSYRPGDICVQYMTMCGTSPDECITVIPQPKINAAISGPSILCPSASNIIYSIPPAPGASVYEWAVPTGATFLSGQGTNQIKVSFGTHSGIVTVTASNNCGPSTNQFIEVTLGGCIKSSSNPSGFIESKEGNIKIKTFPNPSSGILHLDIQSKGMTNNHQLQLIDALGRVVYTSKVTFATHGLRTLDLRHLSTGLYILNLTNETEIISTKIVLR